MIKLENTEVMGWEAAIRGMRNLMNSWERSDSHICAMDASFCMDCKHKEQYCIGPNDLDLMTSLRKAGADHRKFMRMVTVYVDILAPLYWWKEFDTYKVGTVANSCSTMHKIAEKEFTLEDFSHEHMNHTSLNVLKEIIELLHKYREDYLNPEAEKIGVKKDYWWQTIQLLPSSYNQRRTVMLNYEVLANIYKSRRNHKFDE